MTESQIMNTARQINQLEAEVQRLRAIVAKQEVCLRSVLHSVNYQRPKLGKIIRECLEKTT